MALYKKLLLIFCLAGLNGFCFAQKQKIYFLADTVNISKANRILEIGGEPLPERLYTFYCKCLPPYTTYIIFSYLTEHKLGEIVDQKPSFDYLSWKELQDILVKVGWEFKSQYELYITEVLPGNRYRTNKVQLGGPPNRSIDRHIFKQ